MVAARLCPCRDPWHRGGSDVRPALYGHRARPHRRRGADRRCAPGAGAGGERVDRVRPSATQWAAMAVIIAGGVFIARTAVETPEAAEAKSNRITVLIAIGACLAYVVIVLAGQAATPLIGAPQTMWMGRWTGLIFIAGVLLVQRAPLRLPVEWLPFVGLQAGLDTLGYIAFLAGSNTEAPQITMVVASAFSVVAVLLARIVIDEPVSKMQWAAIALIAGGTAVLSAT